MWTSSFRYDKNAKKELDFIISRLGLNKSQAISQAIHLFYKALKESNSKQKSPAEIFLESGFVGQCNDDTILSTNYKEFLTEYMKEKYEFFEPNNPH